MTRLSIVSKLLLGAACLMAVTSAHALSLASVLHLHMHLAAAGRQKAELKLDNPNSNFRDVRIGGHVYTVRAHHDLIVTGPVGTPVYAASGMFRRHAKGAVVAQVESGRQTVALD